MAVTNNASKQGQWLASCRHNKDNSHAGHLTENLPPNLPAFRANLVPRPTVHFHGAVSELAGKNDDFPDNQLRYATRVREGRVEYSYSLLRGIVQIHLVRADTEASNNEQVLRLLEDLLVELRLRTDTDNVDVPVSSFLTGFNLERVAVYR